MCRYSDDLLNDSDSEEIRICPHCSKILSDSSELSDDDSIQLAMCPPSQKY